MRGLVDPQFASGKNVAYSLGITTGTMKVYLSKIYDKLGWPGGSQRIVSLWAIAHRVQLGIELPTAAQFPQVPDPDAALAGA